MFPPSVSALSLGAALHDNRAAVRLMTACGMLALFVGVTNCPISTLLIGFEMFGYQAMPYFVLVIA